MKSKSKFLLLMIFLIFLGLIFDSTTVRGTPEQRTTSTIADEDTWVDYYLPLDAFGDEHQLRCSYRRHALFHFSFSNKPSDITKAELSLDISGVNQTTILTMNMSEEQWDEGINWFSAFAYGPFYSQALGNFTVSSNNIYKINLTSILTPKTEISIGIYIANSTFVEGVYITSKEGYTLLEEAPQIIWTYFAVVSIPSYNIFIIIGIISAIGIFLVDTIKRKKDLIL